HFWITSCFCGCKYTSFFDLLTTELKKELVRNRQKILKIAPKPTTSTFLGLARKLKALLLRLSLKGHQHIFHAH
ncbi:MAG: hypothetical protein K8F24_11630, partial [Bacteroidales bacterium]|nr:hypothetical protein [Bacteroidales bacterium]